MSDWSQLRNQIQQGAEWRGTCNVPVNDDTFQVTIRMLQEEERQSLLPKINMAAILEHREEGGSDAEEEIRELQSKDELTDEEEERLQNAQQELAAQRAGLIEDLGEETFEALREAGRLGLVPDEEDVEEVLAESVSASRERFADIDGAPNVPETRSDAKKAVKAEMNHWLKRTPYPVKFTIGQEVFAASQGEGNSSDESATDE